MNGHSKDVRMDANGVVIEVEEQVRLEALSADDKGRAASASVTKLRGDLALSCVIRCF